MPKIRALTHAEAKATLLNRLGPRVDRVRQIAVNKGLRPYRVFLVWSVFGGAERGEGTEREIARVEILPSPKVISLDTLALSPAGAGVVPLGSVRLEQVSVRFTLDQLKGRMVPTPHEKAIPDNIRFHYELIEDGRGDMKPEISTFRLATEPNRRAGKLDWQITLERTDTVEKP